MIGYVLAGNVLLVSLVLLAILAAARRLARRAQGSPPPRGWFTAWLVGLPLLSGPLLTPSSGQGFTGLQILLFTWLVAGNALAVATDPARRPAVRHGTWLGLSALVLAYFGWRGCLSGGALSDDYAFVIQDHLGQLLLPALAALGLPAGASEASGAVVVQAAGRLIEAFATLVALAAWGVSGVVQRTVDPGTGHAAPAPPRPAPPIVGALALLLCLLAALFGLGAADSAAASAARLARDVLVALPLAAALQWLSRRTASFVSAPLPLLLAGASLLFVELALPALVALGLAVGLLEAGDDAPRLGSGGNRPLRLRDLLAGALVAAALFALLGWVADRRLSALAPAEGPGETPCARMTAEPSAGGGAIVYRGPDLAPFAIDVHERGSAPEEGNSPVQAAEQACRAEGKRLCTSNEWYVACACGHAATLAEDRAWWRHPRLFIEEALLERARRTCPERASGDRAAPSPPTCRSDHGVLDLLGGRTELLGDEVAGGRVLAGRSAWLPEDWMVKCTYRALIPGEALPRYDWPFIGFRCCADSPAAAPGPP